jgi:hypothetical protein
MKLMNWVEYEKYMLEQEWIWSIADYIDLGSYIIYGICIILLIYFINKNYKNNEKKSVLISWIILRLFILFIMFLIFSGTNWYLNCLCIF